MSDRDQRIHIASETLSTLARGLIIDPHSNDTLDLRPNIQYATNHTSIYYPTTSAVVNWRDTLPRLIQDEPTRVEVKRVTTLQAARYLEAHYHNINLYKIGILNFACPTEPGGQWKDGAQEQEEVVVRSSTLSTSLESHTASPFYQMHLAADRGGFYTDTMVYSPRIRIFRDDEGSFLTPLDVDVVSSAAVDAREVRRRSEYVPRNAVEYQIQIAMKERMGRILALFEHRGLTHLVLGGFGTGLFENSAKIVAKIWKELLCGPKARFKNSFCNVVLASVDETVLEAFTHVFERSEPRTLRRVRREDERDRGRNREQERGLHGRERGRSKKRERERERERHREPVREIVERSQERRHVHFEDDY